MSDLTSKLLPIVIGVVFAAAGGFLYTSHQQATSNAQDVEATILNSTVQNYNTEADLEGDYHPYIRYSFTYEGEEHTSENICAGSGDACYPTGRDRSEVQAFVDEYPEDETATAHVPQGDPDGAYLEAGGSGPLYLGMAAVGLLLVAVGGYKIVAGDGEA